MEIHGLVIDDWRLTQWRLAARLAPAPIAERRLRMKGQLAVGSAGAHRSGIREVAFDWLASAGPDLLGSLLGPRKGPHRMAVGDQALDQLAPNKARPASDKHRGHGSERSPSSGADR